MIDTAALIVNYLVNIFYLYQQMYKALYLVGCHKMCT